MRASDELPSRALIGQQSRPGLLGKWTKELDAVLASKSGQLPEIWLLRLRQGGSRGRLARLEHEVGEVATGCQQQDARQLLALDAKGVRDVAGSKTIPTWAKGKSLI